jgi:hypothetical protein
VPCAFSELVPGVDQSGIRQLAPSITKQGDPSPRRDIWPATELARHQDPQLAAECYRLIVVRQLHHYSAICHLATTLLTRIAAAGVPGSFPSAVIPTAPPSTPPKSGPLSLSAIKYRRRRVGAPRSPRQRASRPTGVGPSRSEPPRPKKKLWLDTG